MSLKRNLTKVFSTNIIYVLSNIILNLIIPIYLTVESYGNYKKYILFISYIGFLGFGFIDGIFIKYGGLSFNKINKGLLKKEYLFVVITQVLFTIIGVIIGILIKSRMLILVSISIIPINMTGFLKLIFQALGEFRIYSRSILIVTITNLILSLFAVFVFKINDYKYYIYIYIVTYLLSYIYLNLSISKNIKNIKMNGKIEVKKYSKIGIFILFANLTVLMLASIDKWVVTLFFSIEEFSTYSFALSLIGMLQILSNSLNVVFYNYISKLKSYSYLIEIKKFLIIIGGYSLGIYFILKYVIRIAIVKYIPALQVLGVLILSFPFTLIIQSIIVNLYKRSKCEKEYLVTTIAMLGIAFISNFLFIKIDKNIVSIAYATLFTYIIWYLYSILIKFKFLNRGIRENLYMILYYLLFIVICKIENEIFSFIIYLSMLSIITIIIFRKELKRIVNSYKKRIAIFHDKN